MLKMIIPRRPAFLSTACWLYRFPGGASEGMCRRPDVEKLPASSASLVEMIPLHQTSGLNRSLWLGWTNLNATAQTVALQFIGHLAFSLFASILRFFRIKALHKPRTNAQSHQSSLFYSFSALRQYIASDPPAQKLPGESLGNPIKGLQEKISI
jgi:hypothetical protein